MKRPVLFLLIGYLSGILVYVNSKAIAIYVIVILLWGVILFETDSPYRNMVLFLLIIPMILGFLYSAYTYSHL
ncbi:MAG TPA: hypothetical protein DDZ89_00815, partial [Clostridiales bacterium]|nr:hypothetical protein [Clostridiales bacterium]